MGDGRVHCSGVDVDATVSAYEEQVVPMAADYDVWA
ncbi:hypothetical protein JOF41_005898 [Saccharothrix coeruleofusca]|nr:hypothetical protein [Saccharothrix coeruleofusca]